LSGLPEFSAPLGVFTGHQMACPGFVPEQFSFGGAFDSFGYGFTGLHFRHKNSLS